MRCNFRETFGDWINKQVGVELKDFVPVGTIFLTNISMTPDSGGQPIKYNRLTQFEVQSNQDGSIYKLTETDYGADRQGEPGSFKKRVFTLKKEDYEKLLMFPKAPSQQPSGGGGLPGMPF